MIMKNIIVGALILGVAMISVVAAETEDGFVTIFDGKTFNGWKPAQENSSTWKIEDGAFVTRGARCHLFYVGDPKPFRDFELKVDRVIEFSAQNRAVSHTGPGSTQAVHNGSTVKHNRLAPPGPHGPAGSRIAPCGMPSSTNSVPLWSGR